MGDYWDDYFYWICDILDAGDDSIYSTEDYHCALRTMFDLAFDPKIALDENRIDDVRVYLRDKYAKINSDMLGDDARFYRVSILEVLVATSIRMSEMMGEEFAGKALPRWQAIVWEALENVGITTIFADECFDDADYEGINLTNSLLSVLCKINRRGYSPTGDRKSTRLNSSHDQSSYAVFCLKKNIASIGYDQDNICLICVIIHFF